MIVGVHMFHTHLRPERFPVDLAMSTGATAESDVRRERTAYYERLAREGRIEGMVAPAPSARRRIWAAAGGLLALMLGVALAIAAIVDELRILLTN